MNRSRGPIPPQTDHPDEWPELTTSEHGQQREQYAPLSQQANQQVPNQVGAAQYGQGGAPQAGQQAGQQQSAPHNGQQGAAAPNDQALNGWQRPVMQNDETTGRPAVHDQQAAGQAPGYEVQGSQVSQGQHLHNQQQLQNQQVASTQQQAYQPISSEAGGFPVAPPAQPLGHGQDAPPAYAQQPQYTAPPVGTEFPAPPEFPAPQEYTAPPEFTAPSEYTAPPEFTAPADYTQPPQQQLAPPPAQAALPPQTDEVGDETSLQFERYAPSATLATAPDVVTGQNAGQSIRLGDLGHAADAGAAHWQQSAAPTANPNHGHDPAAQNHAPQHSAPLNDETANYDLARYAPIQNAAAGYAPGQVAPDQPYAEHGAVEPSFEQTGFPEQTGHAPQWNDANEHTGAPVQQHDGHQHVAQQHAGFEPAAMAPEGYQHDGQQHDVRQHAGHQQDYDSAALDDNYQDPPNGGRGLLIAASLVGAIAIGGGLAYGYKHFGNSGSTGSNNLRTIVADNSPVKVKPNSPGGRIFRNKDRKVFSDRLRSGQGTRQRNGVRKVPTLVITRNGNVAPPVARPAVRVAGGPSGEAPRLAVPGVFVPGLTMTAPRVAPQRRIIRPIATAPPSRPVQIAPTQIAVLPKARPLPPRAPVAQVPSSSRVIVAAPIGTNPQPDDALSTSAAPAFAGASGYVAWISSSKDKVRTLASFASLQQKFPNLLAGKQPEIQRIVIRKEGRSKGTWYRLRIGPPASKDATRALCTALVAKKGARECHVRKFR